MRRFDNQFHERLSWVTKLRVKIIALSPHGWQKSLFTLAHTLFHFLHAIYQKHATPLKQLSIAHLAIVAKDGIFDLAP